MLAELALPVAIETRSGAMTMRRARSTDLDALMRLLADDEVSRTRGDVLAPEDRPRHAAALEAIAADPSNDLLVVVDAGGELVGTLQLTRIPGMARRGSVRLLVEAVRVSSALRSSGIGGAMMRWVTDVAAPGLEASLVQLTSDAVRTDAHRFYERLGFTPSHLGFKFPVPAREGSQMASDSLA